MIHKEFRKNYYLVCVSLELIEMYQKLSLQLLGQWGSNWFEHSDGGLISSRGIHNVAGSYLTYLTKTSSITKCHK